jgi:multidrug resistance efflux pump
MTARNFVPRFIVTMLAVAAAGFVAWQLWIYYMDDPWTRDGRVRADVVEVAPDVSGLVARVFVQDNQAVRVGDPLFQVDPARFAVALRQAQAVLAKDQAALGQAERDARRYAGLSGNAVSDDAR